MKATALIAAAALACGTAAYAQQATDHATRHDDTTRAEQQDHSRTGDNLRGGMHRLGEKIRNGMHRLGDKLHARNERHDDTRAMGASGTNDHGRQARMDEAYSHWRSQHERDQQR